MRATSVKLVLLSAAVAAFGWGQAPTISTIVPASAPAGSPALTLTVNGTGFLFNPNAGPGGASTVFFDTTALPTTYVSSTTLSAAVPASLLAAATQYGVHVTNPGTLTGGGLSSNTVTFAVLAPSVSSLSVTSIVAGSPAFVLTVSGANYLAGSQISFKGTALTTTYVNSTTLTATVPANLIAASGQVNVQVTNPGGAASNALPFTVLAANPTITSLSPASITAGSAAFNLTVNGSSFLSGAQVSFDGNALSTSFVSSTSLTAAVPAALVAAPKSSSVVVTNPGGLASPAASFTVNPAALAIVTTSLPPGTAGSSYSYNLTGKGGTPPYTWSATGLPAGMSVNSSTGAILGTPQTAGTYYLTVGLRDAANATASAPYTWVVNPPALAISGSSSLPSGTVGVAYTGTVIATGGSGPYTFSLGSGHLPDGLTLSAAGAVAGTPKTPGQFTFAVVATDSTGASVSASFTVTIQAPPLTISGGPTGPVATGSPINIVFVAAGGVGPYTFSISGTLPTGTFFSNGAISGTPSNAGTFTLHVTVTDSAGTTASKDVTLTVTLTPPSLSLPGGALSDGKVGVPYTGQISATGGTAPYTYAGTGLPAGLSLSASGAVTGTPTAAGQFSFTATATDSKGATANGTFRLTIAPADLIFTVTALPDGAVGVPYSASLGASGGVPPYTWTVALLPPGLTATAAGAISGTPTTAGKYIVAVGVTDAAGTTFSRQAGVSLTIAAAPPAPLAITTASAPNGTVGTAYSASFAATGGTAPYTFSATGLPAGLTMSAAGAISGTPTTPGAATIVVNVKDAAGATGSKSFPVNIALPAAPPLNVTGAPATTTPLQQPRVQVALGNSFPVDVTVTLTLSFTPDSGADDPTIQFSSGGRTARITVPAGSTSGANDIGVQTGSVAGLIAITAQMQAAGQDVTPAPAPRATIRIAAAAPAIVAGTLTAVRNATGFTVTLTGYVTDREMTQAIFQFAAASGSNLQTTTLTVALDTLSAGYFGGSSAAPFGSQFTYTQPFTVTGSTQAVASVTVTLVNKIGQSAAATATLN